MRFFQNNRMPWRNVHDMAMMEKDTPPIQNIISILLYTHQEFGGKKKKIQHNVNTNYYLFIVEQWVVFISFFIFPVFYNQQALLYNYRNIFSKAFKLEFVRECQVVMFVACLFLLCPNYFQQCLELPSTQRLSPSRDSPDLIK